MIELKGEANTYRLDCASTNALCRLEELTGRHHETVLAELCKPKPKKATLRAFLASALLEPPKGWRALDRILADIGGAAVIRSAAQAATGKRVSHG